MRIKREENGKRREGEEKGSVNEGQEKIGEKKMT